MIRLRGIINGDVPVEIEINAAELAGQADELMAMLLPEQLNQKQAAKFLGESVPTFVKRNPGRKLKTNSLGKYSRAELQKLMGGRK